MRLAHVFLFLAAFGLFGLGARGRVANTDTAIATQAARAWLLRGDPALLGPEAADASGVPTWAAEQAIVGLIQSGKYGMPAATGDQRYYIWFPIGYQALIVPCVALARFVEPRMPAPEKVGAFIHPLEQDHAVEAYWTSVFVSWLSPLGAALALTALASLAVSLGAARRTALGVALVATLCTQFWPGSREALSNMPGAGLALTSVACMVAWIRAGAPRSHLVWAGLLSGASVLIRYPIALSLAPFWAAVAWTALGLSQPGGLRGRAIDWKAIALFGAAGLPFALLMRFANLHRFGDPSETGYSPGQGFGSFPFDQGLLSILLAPGKGIVWFSPLLVWLTLRGMRNHPRPRGLGLACVVTPIVWVVVRLWIVETIHPFWILAGLAPALGWMAWSVKDSPKSMHWLAVLGLLAPIAMFSNVVYWAAGMCWGIRYLAAPIALLVVFLLVKLEPWKTHRRAFSVAAILGFVISLGGVVTDVPSQHILATTAMADIYPEKVDANLDLHTDWHPLASPVHSHWTMFVADQAGWLARRDAAPFVRTMYGVDLVDSDGAPRTIPLPITSTDGNNLWWRNVELAYPQTDGTAAFLVLLAWTVILGLLACWRWSKSEPRSDSPLQPDR